MSLDSRAVPLAHILQLNTRLFRNCLDGVDDEQARARPSGATNSMAFVAGHLVSSRFYLLKVLGAVHANPLASYLDATRSIDQIEQLPPLALVRAAWITTAEALDRRLETIAAAELDALLTTRLPALDKTVLGVLTFLVQHDSYHVGQLALLRKYAGLTAMSYA